jgi:hypothetical protein
MWTIHQLAPAHARFIHDFIIIKTRINVKRSFAGRAKNRLSAGIAEASRLLSLLDKRNATVNYSNSR